MDQNFSKYRAKGYAVERRIRKAISTLRQSKSDQNKRSAQKILLENSYQSSKVRHDMFVELFNSMLDEATSELLYLGDQPLPIDHVVYLVVREALLRLADKTSVEAAEAAVEEALEVVALTFDHGEAN